MKNAGRSCADAVPEEARHALAHCERVHNAAGRDIATLLLFVSTYYYDLPRVLLVGHDHEPYQWKPLLSMTELSGWVRRVETEPLFVSEETCLCVPIVETHFRECDKPLPEETLRWLLPAANEFSCYGVWWTPARWILEHILEADWRGGTIRWPSEATFAVPASAIRKRPKVVYTLLLSMLNASTAEDRTERPDGQLGLRADGERYWPGERLGHVMERLMFALFDVNYRAPP